MKVIILAAGEGIRMRPLTENTPKPMLKIQNKPILEHILDYLPPSIDQVVLVVGYLHQQIQDHFGDKYKNIKIDYVIQPKKLGTYHALELCKDLIKEGERFIVTYADDLHGADNFKRCSEADDLAILVLEAEDLKKFGVVEIDDEGFVKSIEEKPENPKSNLVSTGVLVLNTDVFKYPAPRNPNGEYYLADSVGEMVKAGYKFKAIRSSFWLPIGYPEDLEKAEKILNQ